MVVASVERTAYPRFKRIISERELAQFFTPDEAETAWAAKRTHDRPESLLTLLVLLKSCARLGCFPGLGEVPALVVTRARAAAGLPENVMPLAEERTVKRYRSWIREYLGLAYDPARARGVAAAAMEEAAPVRASVVDLVNVALEELVRAGLELPGYYGGIAHHLVADTYVALFSRFVPCGVWEAVYLIDSLLQNQSAAQPEQVHADTQGQSFPVFGLAHVLGIDRLPRIRNFQDLTFHRPDPAVRYQHIDQLFSTDPRTAIDWGLLRRHWPDLMQVALSVKQGTVSSVTLLRRLNNRSHKNQIYQAFREVGRAVRTAVLLRYLSDPQLREQIQRATNKAEAYNGFTKWLHFGNAGWLTSRDPELQDKAVKFLDLVAASVIFSTTIDMTRTLRQMTREGWTIRASDLAVLSPYRRENVLRFGDYTTDQLHIPPPAYNPTLRITDEACTEATARR
ncbi:Tn3 family transposase [Streptomyces sp. NPDC015220]|uniref:Tn3 family transposase n=1 Tax=Streptomyces sp. NPDC015220 TaxID=3364947 RepID=UPI0036FADB48